MTEETIVSAKDSALRELDSLDFSTVESIDIDKYYGVLEDSFRDKNVLDALEAEICIKNLSPKYMLAEAKTKIDKSVKDVEDLIKLYDVEKDIIKNATSQDFDKIFAIVKHFNLKLSNTINQSIFSLTLKREEIKLIVHALKNDLKYNGNDVLMIGDLDTLVTQWNTLNANLPKTVPTMEIDMTIRETIVLYQYLSKFEVVGMGNQFQTLKSIMNSLREVNELFNALNIIKERVANEFLTWSSAVNEYEKIRQDAEASTKIV